MKGKQRGAQEGEAKGLGLRGRRRRREVAALEGRRLDA
jgi:hypothetical protein